MKLFCARCKVFFESDEVVYKEEIADRSTQFLYYHKQHIPKGAKIVAYGTARAIILSLSNSHKGGKMLRKTCAYEKCQAVFCTTDKHRKFCSDECYHEHAKEMDRKRNLTRHRRVGNKMVGRWGDGRQLEMFG